MGPVSGDLFDSTIVIDHLNGFGPATDLVLSSPNRAISVITWMEALVGIRLPDHEAVVRDFLETFTVHDLTPEVREEAVRIRRSTRLKLPDAIILATARVHRSTLHTRNTKDFSPDDPNVAIPYTL